MNTTDTGITITLTAGETIALGKASAFYIKSLTIFGPTQEQDEIARNLHSLLLKIEPLVKQKAEEERNNA